MRVRASVFFDFLLTVCASFVQIDELCLVRSEFIHFNISLVMKGERHKVLDTLDQYHLLGYGLQSGHY